MTGLAVIISTSSSIMIGFIELPSISSLTSFSGGSPAFRQVACRAKQARGAIDDTAEHADMLEMEEDREDLELSDIIDSGDEVVLIIDGRRESGGRDSMLSMVHLFMLVR